MSHTAIILLALAFLIGWMGGRGMSIIVPLHKWRSADPAILIGRRCIARTDQDVVIDGRLELTAGRTASPPSASRASETTSSTMIRTHVSTA